MSLKQPFNLLTQYVVNEYKVNTDRDYEVFDIDAKELINDRRIDLMIKYIYIDCKEKGINFDFAKEMYIKHIEAFSKGTYTEPGSPEKNSIEKYLNDFDKLIYDIKHNGFNPEISLVPIGKNNELLDGSHRVACAAYFNKKVRVIKFPYIERRFGYDFFRTTLLDDKYLDYAAAEYCHIKNDVYVACIWPKAKDKDKRFLAEKLFNDRFKVVYKKSVKLNYKGIKNLMIQIYGHQSWIGNLEDEFSGADSKAHNSYDKSGYVDVYLIQSDSFDKVLEAKEDIRTLFGIGKDSVHISDDKREAIQIAELMFNDNSIHHLNNAIPYKYKKFNQLLSLYKSKIQNEGMDLNDFIIDSNSVMAIYGMRKTNDINFISIAHDSKSIEDDRIQSNDNQLKYYSVSKNEVVNIRQNYFVYNELRFTSLLSLKNMKKLRNEKRDRIDIIQINKYIKFKVDTLRSTLIYNINYLKRKERDYLRSSNRNCIIDFIIKVKNKSIYLKEIYIDN